MVATDFIWGKYIDTIAKGKALAASSWSVLVSTVGAMVVIGYVNDPWMVLPAGAGAFVGTFLSVRYGHKV